MAEQIPLSMDEILGDKEPAREPAAPTEKPAEAPAPPTEPVERATSARKEWQDKEQAAQGRVRDPETGQFAKAEEKPAEPAKEPAKPEAKAEPVAPAAPAAAPAKPAAPPQQDLTEKEKAFLRAAQEERGKRQELERRLAALEARKTQPAPPADQDKTYWDDPEAANAKLLAEVRKETISARLQTAEFIARQKHQDFDEKIAVFNTLAEKNPGLVGQMLAVPDPAEYAYSLAKNHMEIEQAGGVPALRAQIVKEERIKLEEELRVKAEALAKERAALPPSLSEAPSKGANRQVWSGPPSMDEILKG